MTIKYSMNSPTEFKVERTMLGQNTAASNPQFCKMQQTFNNNASIRQQLYIHFKNTIPFVKK
jgi:hypothetical protein